MEEEYHDERSSQVSELSQPDPYASRRKQTKYSGTYLTTQPRHSYRSTMECARRITRSEKGFHVKTIYHQNRNLGSLFAPQRSNLEDSGCVEEMAGKIDIDTTMTDLGIRRCYLVHVYNIP